jgi:hypothetical protein
VNTRLLVASALIAGDTEARALSVELGEFTNTVCTVHNKNGEYAEEAKRRIDRVAECLFLLHSHADATGKEEEGYKQEGERDSEGKGGCRRG